MMMRIGRERLFWLGIGAGGVAVFLLLVLWAVPAHNRASRAAEKWRACVVDLEKLQGISRSLPSQSSVKALKEYRVWVQDQADLAEAFFYDRSAILSAPLTGTAEDVTASQFKEAYIRAVYDQRGWLEGNRTRMKVEAGKGAFPTYGWMTSTALPDPKAYGDILCRYWAYKKLYEILLEGNVRIVRGLEVGSPYASPRFSRMSIQANLVVRPRDMDSLIRKLLRVSRNVSGRPVIQLTHMTIGPETAGVSPGEFSNVKLGGYVMLFQKRE